MAGIKAECVMIKSLPERQGSWDIMNYLAVITTQSFVDHNQLVK